ncbi:Levanase precursor [Mycobacteroides abscessus subsp. abscessus]|nr:Levanase precursor [Mycobacteroides abscessus subsp. abscessus]
MIRKLKWKKVFSVLLILVLMYQSFIPFSVPVHSASLPVVKDEIYRPGYHFTPEKNWMNDPNGMVYYNGEYHLFYQHNPTDKVWGPMYWGHAISKDLVNWEHYPISVYPDENGFAWSGSAVVDYENTSGLGTKENPPMVALYTSELGGDNQHVSVSYSGDSGRTWSTLEQNPIISMPNELKASNGGSGVFRDPKVFWHEQTKQWMFVITSGKRIDIYSSTNLLDWKKVSEFSDPKAAELGLWECPDLFELPLYDTNGNQTGSKWLLTVSINPTPTGGTGMHYYVGEFNGTTFTPDDNSKPLNWADYGADFYAAVTWSNTVEQPEDGRRIWLGWMNNPAQYAGQIPTSTWRGATTVPRELSLVETNEGVRLKQQPVKELISLRDTANEVKIANQKFSTKNVLENVTADMFELEAEFNLNETSASEFGFQVRKGDNEGTTISYQVADGKLSVNRTQSGETDFHKDFPSIQHTILTVNDGILQVKLLVDRSSVEVFAEEGTAVFTNQIFPSETSKKIELYAKDGEVSLRSLSFYPLKEASFTKFVEDVDVENLPNTIENPNFETGDLTGWTTTGSAFRAPVSDVKSFWGGPFEHEGIYHSWGFLGAKSDDKSDLRTGVMKSSNFVLEGNGVIDFLVGGGQDLNTLYVALVNASTGEELMKATGANTEKYRRVKWDASEYLGEALFIKVVDYHSGGFGHINVDDFHVFNEDVGKQDDLINPGFETGDLTGWTAEGNAFNGTVTDQATYWDTQIPFEHQGKYHLWGFNGADPNGADQRTGTLTSNTFELSGNGDVSFLVGGGDEMDGEKKYDLYVALVRASDGKELFKATGPESESYKRVTWKASEYVGEKVYIKVVDQHIGGFGHLNVDDFQVKGRGMLSHWSFDEQKGHTALESVKNEQLKVEYVFNEAKYKPSTDPLWRKGVVGQALLFDGYSTYINQPIKKAAQPSDALTIEAWVAPRSYEWGDLGQLSAIVNQHNKAQGEGYILGMGRHGKWSFQAGMNGEWKEVWAKEDKPLEKDQWSYIVATFDQDEKKMKLFLNGDLVGEVDTPRNATITATENNLLIGKHNSAAVLSSFTANMFNGMIDDLKIYNKALSEEEIKSHYQQVITDHENEQLPLPDLSFDRSVYDGDRYRPQYHFLSPGHWMNEPHAPFFYNGKYHLFYQHNPQGPYWHQIHWGHAVSDDMVHWEDAPVALAPSGVSPDGVWSGSASFDENGEPVLFFTAGDDSKTPNQMTGLAKPMDVQDPMLKMWDMLEHPVTVQAPDLPAEEGKVMYGQFRDPFVWQDGDTWYQIVGSGIENVGGSALLYTSKDLENWEYNGPFFTGNSKAYPKTGDVWELPVFLPIGKDANGEQKYAFFINPWFKSYSEHNVKYVFHWVGSWDKEKNKFIPDHEEPKLFDYGVHFTGPSGMIDDKGRSILFSIAQDRRTDQEHYDAGWAHNAGLPLELSLLKNGELGVEPIKELETLRGKQLINIRNSSLSKANKKLEKVKGDMLEIILEIKAKSDEKYGIKVRQSGDSSEEVNLYFDETNEQFGVDASKMSVDPDVAKTSSSGTLSTEGENVKLHIFLDRSMIETYANGQKSITTRAYPTKADALGLELWSKNGKANIVSMKVYEMGSAYSDTVVPAYYGDDTPKEEIPHGELMNHDFQTGDLTGWTIVEGNTFTNDHVTNKNDWGWGGPFGQATTSTDPNKFHLWGFHPDHGGDAATGVLKSADFVLGGDGQIDFLTSGGADEQLLYVALVDAETNEILMKATGHNGEAYRRVRWDASEFIGRKLYIQVVDKHTGGWGHINLDDVNVPVELEEEQ